MKVSTATNDIKCRSYQVAACTGYVQRCQTRAFFRFVYIEVLPRSTNVTESKEKLAGLQSSITSLEFLNVIQEHEK